MQPCPHRGRVSADIIRCSLVSDYVRRGLPPGSGIGASSTLAKCEQCQRHPVIHDDAGPIVDNPTLRAWARAVILGWLAERATRAEVEPLLRKLLTEIGAPALSVVLALGRATAADRQVATKGEAQEMIRSMGNPEPTPEGWIGPEQEEE